MKPTLNVSLIDRYLAGACTPDERAEVDRYLVAHPGAAAELIRTRESVRSPSSAEHRAKALERFAAAAAAETRRGATIHARPQHRMRWMATGVAATLLLTTGVFQITREISIDVPPGEPRQVELSDGSVIMLRGGSRLSHPRWKFTARTVTLEGAAYFTVERDTTKPFTVLTRTARTRVLGTRFVVRNEVDDSVTQVIVTDGSVGVQDRAGAGKSIILRPGNLARVADRARLVEQSADTTVYTRWTTRRIVLDQTPFRDAVDDLEQQYGIVVMIRRGDSVIGDRRVSATFENESLASVLDALALLLDASYKREGRTVSFTHRGTGTIVDSTYVPLRSGTVRPRRHPGGTNVR